MSLYKRPGSKLWWYKFNYAGKRIQASAGTTNKDAARKAEAAHRVRLALGKAGIVEREALTLAQLASKFTSHVEIHAPRSKRFYGQQTAALLAWPPFAETPIAEIRQAMIAKYSAWRRKHVGIATTNRALATLRRMLRLAAEWELIAAAPPVKLLPGEKPRESVLTREQEADYLDGFTGAQQVAVVLMIETGMRPGETLALRWTDVHLDDPMGAYIAVRREVAKRQKPRAVPLSRRAVAALKSLGRSGPHVFGERRKQALSRLQKRSRRIREAMGLPADLVPHSMRHTGLTRIGEAGADAFTIAKLAGHASVTTSQRYVHPVPETLRRAIDRAESMATEMATVEGKRRPSKRKAKAANV